jgi:hypothetical protein
MGKAIPRVIHMTHGGDAPPPAMAANVEAIRRTNPGWEVRLYNDDAVLAYIRGNYSERVVASYLKIDRRYGAARADLFRYLLLYNEGGCYLDSKSGTTRPLDEVLAPDDRYLLSKWQNRPGDRFEGWSLDNPVLRKAGITDGEYQQWFIIAVAGHPFLRAVIERVLANIASYRPERMGRSNLGRYCGVGLWGVLTVTGPVAYTLAIEGIRHLHPHRLVDSGRDLGLSYSVLMGDSSGRVGFDRHQKLFGVHYSALDLPVVHLTPYRKFLWHLYRKCTDLRVKMALRTRFSRLFPAMRS